MYLVLYRQGNGLFNSSCRVTYLATMVCNDEKELKRWLTEVKVNQSTISPTKACGHKTIQSIIEFDEYKKPEDFGVELKNPETT